MESEMPQLPELTIAEETEETNDHAFNKDSEKIVKTNGKIK